MPVKRLYWPCVWLLGAGLTACSHPRGLELPASPEQPWQANSSVWSLEKHSHIPDPAFAGFSVPPIPEQRAPVTDVLAAHEGALNLAQLIDIAQRNNPSTRLAWNHAREAALSAGLTDALFLPALTASVVSGEQKLRVPVKLPRNLGSVDVDNTLRGTIPFVTLTWLLFDFGERNALRAGAQYIALAANVMFNASHQKVIRDVTDAYYRHNAALGNVELAQAAQVQHEYVLKAVKARFNNGLATRIDLALAEQAVAQGRLNLVTHQGFERTSYLALTEAMGLPGDSRLQIAPLAQAELPRMDEPLTQQRLNEVVRQRADIAAAYAAVRAAEAGKRAAQAAFFPKVFMAAGWAANNAHLQVGGLGADLQNTASGVLVGVSVPIYDGGLRSKQLSKAEVAHDMAAQRLEQLQLLAVREIVSIEQSLLTALQAHDAATELVRTIGVTYSAALSAYEVGRASTVLLTEAALQLNKAQQAQADAQYAALASATNLAFAMGALGSAQ